MGGNRDFKVKTMNQFGVPGFDRVPIVWLRDGTAMSC